METTGNPRFRPALLHPRHWPTWVLMGLWWLVVQLPYPLLLKLGRAIGKLLYLAGGSRQRIARRNLELCFPRLSGEEIDRLLRENFANYGIGLFELAMSWWWSERRLRRILHIRGLEHIDNLRGQGALLMAMHFTHLELAGQGLARRHVSMDAVYRPHKSPVYEYVQSRGRLRGNPNSRVFPRKDIRGVTRALRNGRVIWYAPDQDYGSKNGVFVPFMGVTAATVTATSKFARLGNAKVIPFSHVRRDDGSGYDIQVHPPLDAFPGADEVADAVRVNGVIEGFIRAHPEQYLWAHRRFKTRPPGEASLYRN